MGLSEYWLNQKFSMIVLEKRVLVRMIKERIFYYEFFFIVLEIFIEVLIYDVLNVKIFVFLGIRILEEYLRKNKMRLLDMFVVIDKDKDWKIIRDEFRKVIREVWVFKIWDEILLYCQLNLFLMM